MSREEDLQAASTKRKPEEQLRLVAAFEKAFLQTYGGPARVLSRQVGGTIYLLTVIGPPNPERERAALQALGPDE